MKKLILLIEDDARNRKLEKVLLEAGGYEVLEAINAQEALTFLKKTRPEIILMDVRLPDTRGTELVKMFRTDENLKGIPIVFVTASAMLDDVQEMESFSNCGYILKPINTRTFVKDIEKCIAKT